MDISVPDNFCLMKGNFLATDLDKKTLIKLAFSLLK